MASGVKVSKLNFELNPRGNLWFNDETTFGHKLLSKMGWSKGKGLGKNEDGIKENIKISKKDTNSGVGWKSDEIPVAVGCLEYENILQNLQKHFKNNEEKSRSNESFEKSLEQRSRNARNHLHYQKFVRVKDLNRYSEKDMKSIFLEKPQKPVREHPPSHPTPMFNSQLSVNDYFAMKIQKKKEEAVMSNENNLTPKSQLTSENFSKKRKFVSENPENETSRKAKLKKNYDDETSSNMDNLLTDKKYESKSLILENPENEKSRKSKLKKKNSDDESLSTKDDLLTDKKSESKSLILENPENEKSRKAKLKKNSDDESLSTKDDLPTNKSSETKSLISENLKNEKSRKVKLKNKNPDDGTLSTKDNLEIDISSEPKSFILENSEDEKSRKAKLKQKYSDDETSSAKDNLTTDKSSDSKESSKRKKKMKKMKKNKLYLQQLKSCLKGRTEYDLEKTRNVSFNEQVSYKILDTSLELCEEINDTSSDLTLDGATCGDEEPQTMEEAGDEEPQTLEELGDEEPQTMEEASDEELPTLSDSDGELENNMLNGSNNENTKNEEDLINEEESGADEQPPQCLDLPKCSGSNFNFWLENQRQASKMKLYKEMMKKIKKNKILRSTNLLDIKGYGNWGL